MAWYHALTTAFAALVRRGREERRMDDEIRFHLEMEARRLVREESMSKEEAALAAKRAFGGVERYKDAVRDERLKVLQAITPFTRAMVERDVVRAQYSGGRI